MSAGSLFDSIDTLQTGVGVVASLTGNSGGDGEEASGVAGAAGLADASAVGQLATTRDSLDGIIGDVIDFDGAGGLTRAQDIVGQIRMLAEGSPTEALDGFLGTLSAADSGMLGQLIETLREVLETVQGLSGEVPVNRTAVVGELLDQILGVIGSMEGPEAEAIAAWATSINELADNLLPIIEEAQHSGADSQQLVVQVFQRALDRALRVFGFRDIRRVLDFSDGIAGRVLIEDRVSAATGAADPVDAAIATLRSRLNGDYPQFREAVVALRDAEQDFSIVIGPLLSGVRELMRNPIFQPGGLTAYLRERMQGALSVQIHEAQKIDDPFNALFDRIDQAIEGIDLSAVQEQVTGFFDNLRERIEAVDLPNLPQRLDQQLQPVDEAVRQLEGGVGDLQGQLQDSFDGLGDQFRGLLDEIGSFDDQGRFTFDFVADLREQLGAARYAIGGNPNDPEVPSIAGTLDGLQSQLDDFFGDLANMLQPVADEVTSAVDTATSAIGDFDAYVESIDMPAKLELLRQKVEEILDQLAPIDLEVLAEPVIEAINENRDKLADIDASSLNDLLRQALKVALDAIVSIDIAVAISDPLDEGYQTIRRLPVRAIDHLQQRYEQAVALLDTLSPSQLLEKLVEAFDILDRLLGQVELSALLAPLDDWHEERVRQPVAGLQPSTLAAPLVDGFQQVLDVFDQVDGAGLIGPVQDQIDSLQAAVDDLDLTAWIDDIQTTIERVRDDIGAIRPSELIQPLIADFERLESELDRFSPSALFEPATRLAQPLIGLLEDVQESVIQELHGLYQAPMAVLDKLEPERLTNNIRGQLDEIIATLEGLRVSGRINAFKGGFFDLRQELVAGGLEVRVDILAVADPAPGLDQVASACDEILQGLRNLRDNLDLGDLTELYQELHERFLDMLPPFARQLLDPTAFRRLMRMADPTRFLEELDQRFQALKDKLIPIRPQDVAAELDQTYDTALALVDGLEIGEALDGVKRRLDGLKDIVRQVRVDFLAEDIDAAIADARSVVAGLSPEHALADLDDIHEELMGVVDRTVPSTVLAGLSEPLDVAKGLIRAVDPRTEILPTVDVAWDTLTDKLQEIDFTIVLSPLVDKLDEIYDQLSAALDDVETAFDGMLGAASGALSGGGAGAGAGVGV